MATYLIKWEVDIEADSPQEAAKIAREMQLDPDSEAVVFDVTHPTTKEVTTVDLMELS